MESRLIKVIKLAKSQGLLSSRLEPMSVRPSFFCYVTLSPIKVKYEQVRLWMGLRGRHLPSIQEVLSSIPST